MCNVSAKWSPAPLQVAETTGPVEGDASRGVYVCMCVCECGVCGVCVCVCVCVYAHISARAHVLCMRSPT